MMIIRQPDIDHGGGRPTAAPHRARFLGAIRARARGLTAAAALAAALGTASPAQAALSGTDWTAQTLPANYFIGGGGPPLSPVSCVPETKFCVVIANDSANIVNGFFIGQATLVTTNAGHSWTGFAGLPSTLQLTAISCVSTSVCWASGSGFQGQPGVAESTDGGQTWTDMTPAAWEALTWRPNSIDCVTARICWLAGTAGDGLQDPAVAKTTDGGATWTMFTNLPTFVSSDPNGTYQLNGISCLSARSCVAGGGLNEADGTATVISTTDGGATWSRSLDPALAAVQQVFSVSCQPADDRAAACVAAASAPAAAGPVAIVSRDGGATWGRMQAFDNTGWLNSISCATARHCWAAGAGTTVGLVGTSNGGRSWSAPVTSDTTNEVGSVSCLSVRVCVATTDNELWVTSDDGGLAGTE